MRRKQAGPILPFIFGMIFLSVGGGMIFFWGWPVIVESKASREWSSTPGTITVSKVESHRGKKGSTSYSHHVEYTFAVDGVEHTGDRVWVSDGWSSSSSSGARRTVKQYPVGSETTVYYDPDAPEACALHTGTTWMTYLPFGFGGVFFVVGALVAGSSVFKFVAAAFLIGAAATTAVGQSVVPTSQNYAPTIDRPRSGADDDDGIQIS